MADVIKVIEKLPRYHKCPGFFRVSRYLQDCQVETGAYTVILGGTNGKGSVGAMLEAALSGAGIQTGCFRSPHVYSFYERITRNRRPVSCGKFNRAALKVLDYFEKSGVKPTFYDVLTAAALTYFARCRPQVLLMEVGMGGLYDPVNAIPRDLTVITNIGHDHSHVLGVYPDEIALRKAAIVRPGVPLVTAGRSPRVLDIFRRKCEEEKAPFIRIDEPELLGIGYEGTTFSYRGREYSTALCGAHQGDNGALALEVLDIIADNLEIDRNVAARGLESARLPWRIEVFSREPGVIFDGSHNRESWENLRDTLVRFPHRDLHLVLCIQKLKNPGDFPREMPGRNLFVHLPRAGKRFHPPEVIRRKLPADWPVKIYPGMEQAARGALEKMDRDDLLVFAGSFGAAGKIREVMEEKVNRG